MTANEIEMTGCEWPGKCPAIFLSAFPHLPSSFPRRETSKRLPHVWRERRHGRPVSCSGGRNTRREILTRWIVAAVGAASLAGTTGADAQTYIVDDPYAVAPPPVFEVAPLPAYAPAPVYVAPPPVYAPRRVYVEPEYVVPRASRRVIITDRYAPADTYVEAGW